VLPCVVRTVPGSLRPLLTKRQSRPIRHFEKRTEFLRHFRGAGPDAQSQSPNQTNSEALLPCGFGRWLALCRLWTQAGPPCSPRIASSPADVWGVRGQMPSFSLPTRLIPSAAPMRFECCPALCRLSRGAGLCVRVSARILRHLVRPRGRCAVAVSQ
jgi:hypothetical protein